MTYPGTVVQERNTVLCNKFSKCHKISLVYINLFRCWSRTSKIIEIPLTLHCTSLISFPLVGDTGQFTLALQDWNIFSFAGAVFLNTSRWISIYKLYFNSTAHSINSLLLFVLFYFVCLLKLFIYIEMFIYYVDVLCECLRTWDTNKKLFCTAKSLYSYVFINL